MSEDIPCIKNFHLYDFTENDRQRKEFANFNKGKFYKIKRMYGDPQAAIEKFGIYDYVPIECIGRVEIDDDNGNTYSFAINQKYRTSTTERFFDYFEIIETEKYNL